jgi:anaerobic selenocysteine-containing dehydrogenase
VNRYLERVYHPERLLYPMRRIGPKGSGLFEQICWDEALGEIARRWRWLSEQYGGQTILPYSYAGTLGLVQGTVAAERFWHRLGASRLERAICGAAAEEAVTLTVGGRLAPSPQMIPESKLILIWGSNPASTAPHIMPFLREAQRQGSRVIVVDPLRTLTARSADQHIQPFPGTDAALALGLMYVMVEEGLHQPGWLADHTIGWELLLKRVKEFPPERAAHITGLARETVVDLAREYATSVPALLRISDGINRHTNGGQTVRTLACLPALTGQYGLRGGGLMYSTSDWVRWEKEAVSHEHDPACPPAARTLNMNRLGAVLTAEADPPVYSLYVFNANPAASSPNTGRIVQGLLRDDLFTVVHELFLTDTARYADIVLPATSQLEQVDVHKPYGQLSLQYNMPAIEPVGEARSNWDVLRALAGAMGFEEPWLHEDADAVIRGVLAASIPLNPPLAGVTFARLQDEGALPFALPPEREAPFADGVFGTPSGKVEIYSEQAEARGYDPVPGWVPEVEARTGLDRPALSDPLPLLCPAAHHFISSSFANIASLRSKEGRPTLRLHPEDAQARHIRSGQWVRVSNERGWCQLVAEVTTDVRPGVLATTSVWWPAFSPGGTNVNATTSDRLADFGGGSTFYTNLVSIEACDE